MSDIGRIVHVPLREVWRHEALDFTKWLQENLDVLSDTLNIELSSEQREQPVGDFFVDLIATNASGELVVIENQLERSNHDHLGKVITYVAMVGAKQAIWIVSEPRPEYVKAIQWLNEANNGSFYLVKVEAIRINDSAPAPVFTVITGPSEATREAGQIKRDQETSNSLYNEFWRRLLEYARTRTPLHRSLSTGKGNWIATSADLFGVYSLGYSLSRGKGAVYLYIDKPNLGKEYNEAVFHALQSKKEAIQKTFGEEMEWKENPNNRACGISKTLRDTVKLEDESTWGSFFEAMVDTMIRFECALRPYLEASVSSADAVLKRMTEESSDTDASEVPIAPDMFS